MKFRTGDIQFPDPATHEFKDFVRIGDFYFESADIVGFGGESSVENLINAYKNGIFPWPIRGLPLPWFCPNPRAILDFSNLRIPRNVKRAMRDSTLRFTIDESFDQVMRCCATAERGDGNGTWITKEFEIGYGELHRMGSAHSFEAWNDNDELVGGIYGVDAGGVFCGESMFFREPNASKLTLLFLIEHLSSKGSTWIDIQTMSPHMEKLGACEISRTEFLSRLKETQEKEICLFD
jgi:leucyl/phenylalanyl-tRNA--protein transferase